MKRLACFLVILTLLFPQTSAEFSRLRNSHTVHDVGSANQGGLYSIDKQIMEL